MRRRLVILVFALLALAAGSTAAGGADGDELCVDAGGPLSLELPQVCVPLP